MLQAKLTKKAEPKKQVIIDFDLSTTTNDEAAEQIKALVPEIAKFFDIPKASQKQKPEEEVGDQTNFD